jgi:hypothetical protein
MWIPESLIRYLYGSQGVDVYNRRQTAIGCCVEVLVGVGPLKDDLEVNSLNAALRMILKLGLFADLESWQDYWMA